MVSVKQIQNVLRAVNPYKCKFTGTEIEMGIQEAKDVMPYLSANVIVPAGSFTGDLLRTTICVTGRSMWLHSIILMVTRPFSNSAESITYQITTGNDEVIMVIDPKWMMTTGFHMEYIVDKTIGPNQPIDMVCSSTQAYGETLVKLCVY